MFFPRHLFFIWKFLFLFFTLFVNVKWSLDARCVFLLISNLFYNCSISFIMSSHDWNKIVFTLIITHFINLKQLHWSIYQLSNFSKAHNLPYGWSINEVTGKGFIDYEKTFFFQDRFFCFCLTCLLTPFLHFWPFVGRCFLVSPRYFVYM